AVKALHIQYLSEYEETLQAALEGDLNDEEMATANALLAGDVVEGAVGSLRSTTEGWGTDTDALKRILRNLSPDERAKVLARYQERFHETLQGAVGDEWGLSHADKQEIGALAAGDQRGADAIALSGAVKEQYTPPDDAGGGGERYITIDRDRA